MTGLAILRVLDLGIVSSTSALAKAAVLPLLDSWLTPRAF